MSHIHFVQDSNAHFKINPVTRVIEFQGKEKIRIMKGDHNSERITFELPLVVDGHPMTTCNRITVHALNIDAQTEETIAAPPYYVNDIRVSPDDPDVALCSWLISRNCTQLVGPLYFRVTFECISNPEAGEVDYSWSTDIYKGLAVGDGIRCDDYDPEEYNDILAQWQLIITQAAVNAAVAEATELVEEASEYADKAHKAVEAAATFADGALRSEEAAALSERTAASASAQASAHEGNARNAEEQAQKAAQRAEIAAVNIESNLESVERMAANARQYQAEAKWERDRAEEAKTGAQNAAGEANTQANRAESAADRAEEAAKNAGTGSGGSGIEVTAKPGQLIRVKEVDEKGNPTAWEAVPWGYTEGGVVEIPVPTRVDEGGISISTPIGLEVGKPYIVNWHGTDYKVTGLDVGAMSGGKIAGVGVGNPASAGGEDNGIPFAIVDFGFDIGLGVFGAVVPVGSEFDENFILYSNTAIIHPIPGELLPEGVPYLYKGYILEETDAVETTDPSFGKVWVITKAPNLTVGETYTVIYNGVPYDCVCDSGDDYDLSFAKGAFLMGNKAAIGGVNTGEPFAMGVFPSMQIVNLDLTGATSVRIGFMGKVGHKIDPRCLPDDVGGADHLIVNITEDGDTYTADKTFAQIAVAISNGAIVTARLVNEENPMEFWNAQLLISFTTAVLFSAYLGGQFGVNSLTIGISSDNSVSVERK